MLSMSNNDENLIQKTITDKRNEISGPKSLQRDYDDDSDKKEYELVPDPPDGGYCWVIVFAAALQTCIGLRLVYVMLKKYFLTIGSN